MSRRRRDDSLVYSSQHGRMCPRCGRASTRCSCQTPRAASTPPGSDSVVRVGRSSKGRKGKPVTTVTGLPLAREEMKALAAELKRRCGSGGTLKDDVIEIQGEHRDTLVEELETRGYRVVRSGG